MSIWVHYSSKASNKPLMHNETCSHFQGRRDFTHWMEYPSVQAAERGARARGYPNITGCNQFGPTAGE